MVKQYSLFDTVDDKPKNSAVLWHLYVDGASRCNPGPAGGGFYIVKDGHPLTKKGFFIGQKTNNEAEYYALLLGLDYVIHHTDFKNSSDTITIFADSLLLVRQISGYYRVKSLHLIPLHTLALSLLNKISYSIIHIVREKNMIADKAANDGIDSRSNPLHSFVNLCNLYGISL